MKKEIHIMLSAGETSGYQHAATLVHDLKKRLPNAKFSGLGGKIMRDAGVDTFAELTPIMGFLEILKCIGTIYKTFRIIKKRLKRDKPDLLVLIDNSGFNLRVAKAAKRLGIKILYYISPQVWATRKARIKTVKENVDMMAVILPFEVDMYKDYQVDATYVGHPLAYTVKATMTSIEAKQRYGLDMEKTTIGLIPGSRSQEIKHHLPLMMAVAQKIHQRYPDTQFIIPQAPMIAQSTLIQHITSDMPKVTIIPEQMYDVLNCCDAAIVTSGTATLETALMNVPQVMVYKCHPFTYRLLKILFKLNMGIVHHIGLCNIVMAKTIIPELIQDEANPDAVFAVIQSYLDDPQQRQKVLENYRQLKETLRQSKVEQALPDLVIDLLSSP